METQLTYKMLLFGVVLIVYLPHPGIYGYVENRNAVLTNALDASSHGELLGVAVTPRTRSVETQKGERIRTRNGYGEDVEVLQGHSLSLSSSPSLSLSSSPSLSFFLSLFLSLSFFLSLFLSLSFFLSLFLSLSFFLSLFLSLSFFLSLFLSFFLSLCVTGNERDRRQEGKRLSKK